MTGHSIVVASNIQAVEWIGRERLHDEPDWTGMGGCHRNQRGSVSDSKLVVDMVQMNLDGAFGNVQPPSGFLV